jgi:2-polyprenyl-6-methoxyphenol hydroxylase-like FAD-dependent oxidoreductase
MNHIAIIGAGTAGLATAIVLARQGIQITIFESVSELAPVGAGLLLHPSVLDCCCNQQGWQSLRIWACSNRR